MVALVTHDHHPSMASERSTSHEQQALKAGAHELQRAAGKVLTYACAAEDPQTLGVALAHIEEALDRLSVGMLQAANAVVGHSDYPDGSRLEPSADALCFHLRRTAERLREPARLPVQQVLDAAVGRVRVRRS